MSTLVNVNHTGGQESSPCVGIITSGIPFSVNAENGVSTHYIPESKDVIYPPHFDIPESCFVKDEILLRQWYAVRTTYGREKKAYDYIVGHGGIAYCPMRWIEKEVQGKKKRMLVSRLPNIFFVYGTEEEVSEYVFDNGNLSYLRFYYTHSRATGELVRKPLVVPFDQMRSLKILCDAEDEDVIVVPPTYHRFETGQLVRVTEGNFAGVVGRVSRYRGQQRVGIVINNFMTIATAYVPMAFLEPI